MTLKSVFCSLRKMCQLMQTKRFLKKNSDMILCFGVFVPSFVQLRYHHKSMMME